MLCLMWYTVYIEYGHLNCMHKREIHIFIDLVRRNKPEYRYLNYLADLCLSDDSAIHVTQDMIGEVLLKDEENKKLLIRTTMDATELDFDQHWDDEEDDRELVKLDWDWDNQGPSTVSRRSLIGPFLPKILANITPTSSSKPRR